MSSNTLERQSNPQTIFAAQDLLRGYYGTET